MDSPFSFFAVALTHLAGQHGIRAPRISELDAVREQPNNDMGTLDLVIPVDDGVHDGFPERPISIVQISHGGHFHSSGRLPGS